MYREKTFKRMIVFMRIRRYIFIFSFVILGLIGAFVVSEFLTDIARFEQKVGNIVTIVTGITIFIIAFILTSSLEFKIQQAYLEMKILKKLNVVSFKLSKLLENEGISLTDEHDISSTSLVPSRKQKKNEKSFVEKLKVDIKK